MLEQDPLSHLLDILGNRNRRRILELLRQKPCFVTEISDRLVLNPKAVIEHLAIMQKEDVISFYLDEKRRKYYYLVQDFRLSVQMSTAEQPPQTAPRTGEVPPLTDKFLMIRRLLDSRERLLEHLEAVEKDIDEMMEDVIRDSRGVFSNHVEAELLLALIHSPLTPIELSDTTGHSIPEVTAALRSLAAKGYVESGGGRYRLCGTQKAITLPSENAALMNIHYG
jgi:ArsR family transcriptional regulator